MIARKSLALTAALLGAGLLGGCAADEPELDALRADPLATVDVPGLTESQRFGQIEFTALGKHEPARLTRLFEAGDRQVQPADLARAAARAEAAGWELAPARNHTWTGTKTVDGRPVALLIRRSHSGSRGVLVAVILTAAA